MKRKYFFVVLFLILAMFLVGCGSGIVTPVISEETQIRDLISKLCLAISDKNWSLAKSYCYPGSSAYLMIEQVESMVAPYPQISDVIIWIVPSIYSINIMGNEATVIASFYVQMWYQGEYASDDTGKGTMILIKSGGEWYFYW
ncbi:MAG: hypothetical protein KJ770_08450 [Actinobacteria bacterium]|nr:hypothetical protein [Actinomycetota bacterium]